MCRAPAAPAPPFLVPRAAPASAPPLPGLALACSHLSTSHRRRPSCYAFHRLASSCSRTTTPSSGPEHILELPTYSLLHLHTPILLLCLCSDHHTPPEHHRCLGSPSTATHAASHSQSSAQIASPSPTEAHQPAQSRSRAPERPDHYAGELEFPPPLGLAVVPLIHRLLAPTKHAFSTTSSRGSSLTTSPPLSCTPATGTPTTSFGPSPPVPVRRRYTATAPLFPDTGHPRDRRESLSIFLRLPLAACGRTNLNYTGLSTQILFQGFQRTSNSVIPWPVG
jgi:hypothetical protein